MQNQSSNKKLWIVLSVLLLLFLLLSYFFQPKRPEPYPDYVSESPAPNGTKAIFTYLKEETGNVKRWSKTPNRLPENEKDHVLLMIKPNAVPNSEELQEYKNFMEKGNTILLFMESPDSLFDLGLEPVEEAQESEAIFDEAGKKYEAETSFSQRLVTNPGDRVLLYDEAGSIALKRPVGDGQLIVSIFPEWLQNEEILKKDHVELVVSLLNEANGDSFLFDEYIHKGKNSGGTAAAYPMWFILFLVQGAILAAIWIWHQGKRFGPIYSPREETVRFSDEGIQALAAWYMRGQNYHDSLVIQADYVKLLLQERWHIPYRKEWKEIAGQLEHKWGMGITRIELDEFLAGLTEVLQRRDLTKQEYVLWSKKIDRLRKVVEEG